MNSPMRATVEALLAPGKGILAADESAPTIEKRFKSVNTPSTEENRRAYRELLFATPGLSSFISGGILFDETIRQKTSTGIPFAQFLDRQGIIPGIKVDKGTIPLPRFEGETITQGLDGLRERLVEYRGLGARFTKWRATIAIGNTIPTRAGLETNATTLALFAAMSQEAGLVPIVEPEILMKGPHTLARAEEAASLTLECVFAALSQYRVVLEDMILKTGMVLSGDKCPDQAAVAAVTEATLRCFRRILPPALPGIMFLSGGQGDVEATQRLQGLYSAGPRPWIFSISFGRALQAPALKAWSGQPGNVAAAQKALHHRAQCNSLALLGKYSAAAENHG